MKWWEFESFRKTGWRIAEKEVDGMKSIEMMNDWKVDETPWKTIKNDRNWVWAPWK